MNNPNVISNESLLDLKTKFQNWSGFSFTAENLEDAFKEIKSMKYTLECEISDYARGLDQLAKQTFKND